MEYWVKIGSYQLKKSAEGTEIKVRVGKFGYIKKFKESDDPEIIKILAFCKDEGFLKEHTATTLMTIILRRYSQKNIIL